VSTRSYGQYCGFARGLEVVGERWALMIVRDLLVGPKRFTDLHRGLPGIPTNVLTARLKELEEAGVVQRSVPPRPERGIIYELTPYGAELDEVVASIGRWGAKALGNPREGETITPNSLVTALRTTFQPAAASNVRVRYELRAGPIVLHAKVDHGNLDADVGPIDEPDLVMEVGPAMRGLMSGEMTAAVAIQTNSIPITGDPKLLELFAQMFKIGKMPNKD
jgi:DNA-binding HxlR family transcriptional regulator